jgi:hypothetical protein
VFVQTICSSFTFRSLNVAAICRQGKGKRKERKKGRVEDGKEGKDRESVVYILITIKLDMVV